MYKYIRPVLRLPLDVLMIGLFVPVLAIATALTMKLPPESPVQESPPVVPEIGG